MTSTPSTAVEARYPRFRYMGSKHRLLPWLREVFRELEFDSVLDAFSGSGCVSFLLKDMGKRVVANDFLLLGSTIAGALVVNERHRLGDAGLERLLEPLTPERRFIERTFDGIFYTPEDLRFLDEVRLRIDALEEPRRRDLALTALFLSCIKRQPRGVFTVAGDPDRYKDGRRDLAMALRDHFVEQVRRLDALVFKSGRRHRALRGDAREAPARNIDLVYLDPPYVPRSDDNCYVKRYHFLEGLASYWRDPDARVQEQSRVRKIAKRPTPFSSRRLAEEGFRSLFRRFRGCKVVLSYSSNGWPDVERLEALLLETKRSVKVLEREHRYHFGTHSGVRTERASVREYLLVATEPRR